MAATDPYRNFKFEVEVQGFVRAGFSKISGFKQNTEVIDYREGGENETPHRLPGQTSFDEVTMERGASNDDDFLKWAKEIFDVEVEGGFQGEDDDFRRDITVYLRSKSGRRVRRWRILRAWPKECSTGDLDASANDVLIETLIIANEGIIGPEML